ncbi:MAG TPA: hypothetical protein VGL56_04335 [Fimbriimonadaceae bacterium]
MKLRVLLPIVFVIAGCGGGGNSTPINALNGQFRQLQAGDSCTYTFSGVYTPTGGTATSVSGKAVHTVISRSGTTITINHVVTTSIYGQTTTQTSSIVETQNADGSTAEVSDDAGANGATRTVATDTFPLIGVIKVGQMTSGKITFTDGEWSTGTSTVTGTALISTPIGAVNTFVVQSQGDNNAGYASTTTANSIPQLGFSAGWTENDDLPKIGQETVTFTIQSTNIPGF